jgi:membrane protease YdiL (CAAX protease family)
VVTCLAVARLTFVTGWKTFGIGRRPLVRDVLGAVAPWLASVAACTAVYWISGRLIEWLYPRFVEPEHPILQSLRAPSMPAGLRFLAVAGALVLAPVSEELLFRGILQSGIKKLAFLHWGSMRHRWIAIGVAAALFGGMHFATPQQVPALIVLGLILGYLYERTGSLILPMLVHMLFNARTLLWNAVIYGS